MLKPLIAILLASALTAMGSNSAKAKGMINGMELSGTFETELAIETVTGDVQKAEFVLTPEISADLTPAVRLTVIGRLRGNIVDELEPGDRVDIELREAYIDTEIGSTYLRVGKQQVVWGQADGLKVLDVLNPQSFREFILDGFEDSRIPLWMVNAEIPVGEAMLQLLWIPDNTYDDIPEAGATFAFASPLFVPQLPTGVPVTLSPLNRPHDFIGDSDVAA